MKKHIAENGGIRLTELEPQFLVYEERENGHIYYVHTDDISKAQGINFLCPLCFVKNGGSIGTHVIICWSRSRGTPECASPGPGRWTLEGTGYADLTMNGDGMNGGGGARSILLTGGCRWHGFVTNGLVTTC